MRLRSLTTWIVLAMGLGILAGWLWPTFAIHTQPLEEIFLRLIKVVVGPLIFATLVAGIGGSRSGKELGRLGLKALIFFEAATTLALFLGLGAANWIRPGAGVSLGLAGAAAGSAAAPAPRAGLVATLIAHTFPQSFAAALANGEILQVVVFSLFFAVALAAAGERAGPVLAFCEGLAQVMFRFTNYVMWFAPAGIFGALAFSIAGHGIRVLLPLLKLVGLLYLTLGFFIVVVLGGVALWARLPLRRFLRAVNEPVLIGFSTASSEAALPSALERMEAMGVPRRIVAFVIPTGYSFNLMGTTLYLSLASLFIAQAAGLHLDWRQQLFMMLTLMLTSKGVAGVSRAAIVILAATAASFGLPMAGVVLLLGVDQLMDMGRTAVNVLGNCLAAAVLARWEGESLAAPAAAAAGQIHP